jgi:hypothetical protein
VAAVLGLVASVGITTAANAAVGPYFLIQNAVSGKCVDVAGASKQPGAPVHQWTCANYNNQLWLPLATDGDWFMLQNRNSNLCLDVQFGSTVPETLVDQQSCAIGGNRMQWHWAPADDVGHLVLQSRLGNVCLALAGVYSGRNGWAIVIHDCATTAGQFWWFA